MNLYRELRTHGVPENLCRRVVNEFAVKSPTSRVKVDKKLSLGLVTVSKEGYTEWVFFGWASGHTFIESGAKYRSIFTGTWVNVPPKLPVPKFSGLKLKVLKCLNYRYYRTLNALVLCLYGSYSLSKSRIKTLRSALSVLKKYHLISESQSGYKLTVFGKRYLKVVSRR